MESGSRLHENQPRLQALLRRAISGNDFAASRAIRLNKDSICALSRKSSGTPYGGRSADDIRQLYE